MSKKDEPLPTRALARFMNNAGYRLYGSMFDLAARSRREALRSVVGSARDEMLPHDARWLAGQLRSRRLERGLDLGCGVGRLVGTLASRCRRLVAVDSSRVMLRRAGRLSRAKNVSWRHYDGLHLPFEPESFDFAVCWRVLQHVARDHAALILIQLRSILKKGGRLYLCVPSSRVPDHGVFVRLRKGSQRSLVPSDERRFSEEEVRFFLVQAGFKIELIDVTLAEFRVVASVSRSQP